jgi:hypothetical protein
MSDHDALTCAPQRGSPLFGSSQLFTSALFTPSLGATE